MAKKAPGATHRVLSPLRHDGTEFAEGDEIRLTDEDAAPLLDVKTVEALPAAPAKPAAEQKA